MAAPSQHAVRFATLLPLARPTIVVHCPSEKRRPAHNLVRKVFSNGLFENESIGANIVRQLCKCGYNIQRALRAF